MTVVSFKTSRGLPSPFGSTIFEEGINFSLVTASSVKQVTLCLFTELSQSVPAYEIPIQNRTGDVWHIFIQGLTQDYFYLYRIDDQKELLIDPYAKEVISTHQWGKNTSYHPLCSLKVPDFDWEGDTAPQIPVDQLIIYEMHVRGFTQDKTSQVKSPGTFLGVIEKIPHLVDLGINAVELLPLFEFNECEYQKSNLTTNQPLYNYWGYSTVNFFSPMQRFASDGTPGTAVKEFKSMVKELHRNGIEVILDVVYNHTSEGGATGPLQSFKGLDPKAYYMQNQKGEYLNFSGCGNTFNCNHPIAQELILDSLRYWVTEMHVDGFRFDLASILTRGCHGQPLPFSPIVEAIAHDPLLSKVKLIAEPWDAAGLYQVGSFFTHGKGRWQEWNGRFRDVVRRFIKGTGNKGEFTTNLCGSQDLYYREGPCNSVNFITAHDGFTLSDLVSYNKKHNLDNGENNKDGFDYNDSWNCGHEGASHVSKVVALRARQMRNFHLALMISKGIPMILMGDEYAHTRRGNNNTWCQDNDLNWFLWDQLELHEAFYRFYSELIHFRKRHPLLQQNRFLSPEDIEFHGKELGKPNWGPEDQVIAFTLKDMEKGNHLYIAFNAGSVPVEMQLPDHTEQQKWHWVVNTSNTPPNDFLTTSGTESLLKVEIYRMLPYSSLMLGTVKQ